jgi:ABC-type lipoprotein export system ATPase subunit
MNGSATLKAEGVTRWYANGSAPTVGCSDVSLVASAPELVVLLGPSGSGKTTLLTLIAGLIAPSRGTIEIEGTQIDALSSHERQRFRAAHVGILFQSFNLLSVMTAVENIEFALRCAGRRRPESLDRAEALLGSLGLTHLGDRYPDHMSHGEQQRVAMLRAMVNQPGLLLADEPTASLDSTSALSVIDMLREYAHSRPAVVLVSTHDLRIAQQADRVISLRDGKVARPEG